MWTGILQKKKGKSLKHIKQPHEEAKFKLPLKQFSVIKNSNI